MVRRRRGTDWARDTGRLFDFAADGLHRDPFDYEFGGREPHWREHAPPAPSDDCTPNWVEDLRARRANIEDKWKQSLIEPPPFWAPQDAYDDLDTWFQSYVSHWLETNKPTRRRFPDEPETNIDGLPIPPWVHEDKILDRLMAHYFRQHAALTDAHRAADKTRTAEHIVGARLKQDITANYFIIHDTAGTSEYEDADAVGRGIHLWISPITLGHDRDWSDTAVGVKIENRTNNAHFIHIELIRAVNAANVADAGANDYPNAGISTQRAANSLFTKQQYEDLTHAYIVNCLRRGRFLTVTVHKEVDRNIRNGHNDPEHFDMAYFYRVVSEKLWFPADTTFGIAPDRASSNNMRGEENVFLDYVRGNVGCANQYGAIGRKEGGGNYDAPDIVPAGGDRTWEDGAPEPEEDEPEAEPEAP